LIRRITPRARQVRLLPDSIVFYSKK